MGTQSSEYKNVNYTSWAMQTIFKSLHPPVIIFFDSSTLAVVENWLKNLIISQKTV